jgi:hypothetical protein
MTKSRSLLITLTGGGLVLAIYAFLAGGPEHAMREPQGVAAGQKPQDLGRAASQKDLPRSQVAMTTPTTPGGGTMDRAVSQILESIHEASISYDARELPKIQPHLIHPDPEVRAAALDGVLTLGDAAGAPLLRQAASTLKDPREAVKYLEAADYLELPSGSLLAGKRKASSAAKNEDR